MVAGFDFSFLLLFFFFFFTEFRCIPLAGLKLTDQRCVPPCLATPVFFLGFQGWNSGPCVCTVSTYCLFSSTLISRLTTHSLSKSRFLIPFQYSIIFRQIPLACLNQPPTHTQFILKSPTPMFFTFLCLDLCQIHTCTCARTRRSTAVCFQIECLCLW